MSSIYGFGAMWCGYRSLIICSISFIFLVNSRFIESAILHCCSLANGSCRSTCLEISIVSVATSTEEQELTLQKLDKYCPKWTASAMFSFWECINETLSEIDKGTGWIGRPCCKVPQSEKCRMACLKAQDKKEIQSPCRKSDEPDFYACLSRQENSEKCCQTARSSTCRIACKNVFASPLPPTKHVRDAVEKYCSQDDIELLQCVGIYTQVTPVTNPSRLMHCCERTSKGTPCTAACKEVLKTERNSEDIVNNLISVQCGKLHLHDPMWQCLLRNARTANNLEPGGSLIQSEKVGKDSAKLQCCFLAATVHCRRVCMEVFSNQWSNSLYNFDSCRNQVESEMLRCLSEVDEPCELGCQGLRYCTNFNHRPTELFRSCDEQSDIEAQYNINEWSKGIIELATMKIPVLPISECHPNIWKAISCVIHIKPCHQGSHVNGVCMSDCLNILNKCLDHNRLPHGQNAVTVCETLSPPGNNTPCISISPYLAESKHQQVGFEVTHPCKPNPCSPNYLCMVNRNCVYGKPCVPHICIKGCKMGDVSQLLVPRSSHIRVPSNTHSPYTHGPKCHMVCYCNTTAVLEDCMTQPQCFNTDESCWYEGKQYSHNTQFTVGCSTCFCYAGEVMCSKKECGSGLPCGCADHYVPVCGANGKTYPSDCLAKCAGLTEDQFEFGACHDSDPCSPNSCHPYDRCVARKRVCLSIRHTSCKQYNCVNFHPTFCSEHPKAPVCDTDNVDHKNICWLSQRRKTLAYYGECMLHCRTNGPVCGHNGETYASECAAWAERVSVDYKGACSAVGTSVGTESRCNGIKCSPPPSEHCVKVFPPGSCCPICGAALRLLYSQQLADWSVEAVRDVNPVVVQTIAEVLREHVKVTECDVFAYLSLESDIIVLFTAVTDSPTQLQVSACVQEAEKLKTLIQQHSPTLLTQLPLSFITTATMIDPVMGCSACVCSIYLIVVLCFINLFLQRLF